MKELTYKEIQKLKKTDPVLKKIVEQSKSLRQEEKKILRIIHSYPKTSEIFLEKQDRLQNKFEKRLKYLEKKIDS